MALKEFAPQLLRIEPKFENPIVELPHKSATVRMLEAELKAPHDAIDEIIINHVLELLSTKVSLK